MEIIKDFWQFIIAGVALVGWSIRVEQRTNENAREIKRLWLQRTEDLAAHKEARQLTNELLAEMRNDIKTLLGRIRD